MDETRVLESRWSPTDDLDIRADDLGMWRKMLDLIDVTLIHKNIELALDWLSEKGQDLSRLFPTCREDFIMNTPKIQGELKEVLLTTSSLIDDKLRELCALADSLGAGKISAKLQLWRAFQLGRRECELCGTTAGVSLLGSGLDEDVLDAHILLAMFASRRLCRRHSRAFEFDTLYWKEWDAGEYYIAMGSCGILDLLPPEARTAPSYAPDAVIDCTRPELFASTEEDLLSQCDLLGRSFLHQLLDSHEPCCEANSVNFVKTGLKEQCDYNQQDCFGRTPFHAACQKGSTSMVCQLLQAGADPTLASHAGLLPIHFAAARGSVEICQMLKSHPDINIHLFGPDGRVARDYALLNNHFATANIMSTEYDPIRTVPTHNLDLHLLRAIMQNSVNAVEQALAAGGNPNALFHHTFCEGTQAETALIVALHQDVALLTAGRLRRDGADLDARTDKGETALHICVRRVNIAGAFWLLENGADILAVDKKGRTVFMLAAKQGREIILKMLIDWPKEASELSDVLNAKDREGHTASDYAFWNRNTHSSRLISRASLWE